MWHIRRFRSVINSSAKRLWFAENKQFRRSIWKNESSRIGRSLTSAYCLILLTALFSSASLAETKSSNVSSLRDQTLDDSISSSFLSGWRVQSDQPVARTNCRFFGETSNGFSFCEAAIKSLLETDNLTSSCDFVFELDNGKDTPRYRLRKNSGSEADKFYCEQAIWESAPFRAETANAHGEIRLSAATPGCSKGQSKALFLAHNSLPEDRNIVVIHVIPCSIIWNDRFFGTFDAQELESLSNLKSIQLKDAQSEALNSFRKEWIEFTLKPRTAKPTRKEILDFAAALLSKYRTMFES